MRRHAHKLATTHQQYPFLHTCSRGHQMSSPRQPRSHPHEQTHCDTHTSGVQVLLDFSFYHHQVSGLQTSAITFLHISQPSILPTVLNVLIYFHILISPLSTPMEYRACADSTHICADSTHICADSTHISGDSTHICADSTHICIGRPALVG